VNASSFVSILKKGIPNEVGGINISFDFKDTLQDKDLRMIKDSDMTVDLLEADGLRDVNIAIASITTTGFQATLTLPFDEGILNAPAATSWVAGDFSLYNNTTTSAVTITSVTETVAGSSGIYDFVIPAQSSSDELVLTVSKNGFEISNTSALTFSIP